MGNGSFTGEFPRLVMVTELLNKVGFKADYEDVADEIPLLREQKRNALVEE
jgi:hypothetical protein